MTVKAGLNLQLSLEVLLGSLAVERELTYRPHFPLGSVKVLEELLLVSGSLPHAFKLLLIAAYLIIMQLP